METIIAKNNFTLLVTTGYMASRAIKETENTSTVALDQHNTICILDSDFAQEDFLTEFEYFDQLRDSWAVPVYIQSFSRVQERNQLQTKLKVEEPSRAVRYPKPLCLQEPSACDDEIECIAQGL